MPIKMISAERGERDGRSGAHAAFTLISNNNPAARHNLKLHMDDKGTWWPEIKVNMTNCQNKDVQQIRVLLAATLQELAGVLQSEEAGNIKVITDMVSK